MTENKELLNYFNDGVTFKYDDVTAVLHMRAVGDLKLTSGNIVSCDPTDTPGFDDLKPLFPAVAPGSYKVEAAVATINSNGNASYEKIAAVRILFKEGVVVKWVPAMLEEEQGKPIAESDVRGYSIESGTSCYFDAEALPYLIANGDAWIDLFDKTFNESTPEGSATMTSMPIGDTNLNAVMFESGMGDGMYGSYWGQDSDGKTIALATDFDLFNDLTPVTE